MLLLTFFKKMNNLDELDKILKAQITKIDKIHLKSE